jgi:hypothetical protein
MRPICRRHRLLEGPSLSAAPREFSAPTEAPYCSSDRGLTHPHADRCEQVLGPLAEGSPRPLLEVFQERPPRLLIRLRDLTRSLPGFERAALIEGLACQPTSCIHRRGPRYERGGAEWLGTFPLRVFPAPHSYTNTTDNPHGPRTLRLCAESASDFSEVRATPYPRGGAPSGCRLRPLTPRPQRRVRPWPPRPPHGHGGPAPVPYRGPNATTRIDKTHLTRATPSRYR